jgi:hypothetical protein
MGNKNLMIFRYNQIKLKNPDAKRGGMTESMKGIFRKEGPSTPVSLYFECHTDPLYWLQEANTLPYRQRCFTSENTIEKSCLPGLLRVTFA